MKDILLSIDCCTSQWTTLGLASGKKIMGEIGIEVGSNQSSLLPHAVVSFLEKFSLNIHEVEYFGVTNGPGSFTGIKIGVAFTQFLAWGVGGKIISLSSLEVMASSVIGSTDSMLLPIMWAGGGKVYACLFRGRGNGARLVKLLPEKAYVPDELRAAVSGFAAEGLSIRRISDTPDKIKKLFVSSGPSFFEKTFPSGGATALLAVMKKEEASLPEKLRGRYLRDPDVG